MGLPGYCCPESSGQDYFKEVTMKAAVDLHIHSSLSACADNEMTPNNIVNMAMIKGLDIIAVTDHNSAANCRAVIECASGKNIVIIPGMEIETSEEVHLLCYFPGIDEALKMHDIVYSSLPVIENREDIFGQQIYMDENDNITGFEKRLLLSATSLSIDDVFKHVTNLGGVVVPAHIDRSSYSILSNLGSIPDYLHINYLELSLDADTSLFLSRYVELEKYNFISSSDAHNLGDILERGNFIELGGISIHSLIQKLKL